MNTEQPRDDLPSRVFLRGETYWLRYTEDGQQVRMTLRTADPAEARTRADGIMRRIQHRELLGAIDCAPGERVYFALDRDASMVKIGISRDPGGRLKALKVNSPNDVELIGSVRGSLHLEAVLHTFLSRFHHRREWFRATPGVLAFLSSLVVLDAESRAQIGVLSEFGQRILSLGQRARSDSEPPPESCAENCLRHDKTGRVVSHRRARATVVALLQQCGAGTAGTRECKEGLSAYSRGRSPRRITFRWRGFCRWAAPRRHGIGSRRDYRSGSCCPRILLKTGFIRSYCLWPQPSADTFKQSRLCGS